MMKTQTCTLLHSHQESAIQYSCTRRNYQVLPSLIPLVLQFTFTKNFLLAGVLPFYADTCAITHTHITGGANTWLETIKNTNQNPVRDNEVNRLPNFAPMQTDDLPLAYLEKNFRLIYFTRQLLLLYIDQILQVSTNIRYKNIRCYTSN